MNDENDKLKAENDELKNKIGDTNNNPNINEKESNDLKDENNRGNR